MQFSTIFKAGAALLLILPPIHSAAAQETVDTLQVYTLDEVIISASRWEQTAQTVGRNVTVISREEIENSIHSNVGDLLAERQSVHIVGNRQTAGSVQSLFLRNADGNQSVVMIDGVRISDPSTPGNSIDLAELSLAGVERIEIVRGSHSTLYGSSAIGGVVNIITRDKPENGFNGSAETGHGTFGSDTYSMQNRLTANYSTESGIYFDLGIAQKRTWGLDATVDTLTDPSVFNPQDRDDFNKLDLNGKIGYKGSHGKMHLSYRRVDQESDLDQSAYVDDDNARIDFQRDLFSYGGTYTISDDFEIKLSGAYSDLNRFFVNDSSVIDANGNYDGIYTENRGEGTLWENEVTGRFQSNGITAIVGLGNTRQTMSTYSYTYSSAFNFESESNLDSLGLEEIINKAFIYTELDGKLVDEEWNTFALGLGARLSDHDQFGTYLTYEINPKVRVSSSALLYGAVTTGFNAPSLFQLYSPAESFGSYTNRGNSSLEPETSLSMEAGWKQEIGSRAQAEVSLFRNNVRNSIEYVYLWDRNTTIGNLGPADYRGDTYINLSEQLTYGLELGLRVRLLSQLRLTGNLTYARSTLSFAPGDIDGSYTGGHHVQVYEGGEFVSSEKKVEGLVRRPRITAHADLTYQPVDRLEVGVSTRFVGRNDDIFYSSALGPFGAVDRVEVDRYNITDLYANYRLSSNLLLKVKIENLFNTDYSEIRGYKTRPRGVYGSARFTF